MRAAEHFLREFASNPQCRSCDPRHVKWALDEIERLRAALKTLLLNYSAALPEGKKDQRSIQKAQDALNGTPEQNGKNP